MLPVVPVGQLAVFPRRYSLHACLQATTPGKMLLDSDTFPDQHAGGDLAYV